MDDDSKDEDYIYNESEEGSFELSEDCMSDLLDKIKSPMHSNAGTSNTKDVIIPLSNDQTFQNKDFALLEQPNYNENSKSSVPNLKTVPVCEERYVSLCI